MARPKALTCDATINGILPAGPITAVDVGWFAVAAVDLTYKAAGRLSHKLPSHDQEPTPDLVAAGWCFDADGALFRLASEAHRIRQTSMCRPGVPRCEQITFEKYLITAAGEPPAAFVCPGGDGDSAGGRARPGPRAARCQHREAGL